MIMLSPKSFSSTPSLLSTPLRAGLTLACLFLAACGQEGLQSQVATSSPGSIVVDPNGSGLSFIADYNQGGNASDLRLARVSWGRMVGVFGLDSDNRRVAMNTSFLIGGDLISDSNYLLETNPVTSEEVLVILRDVTDFSTSGGHEQFYTLLRSAGNTMSFITPLAPGQSGIYSQVPRNSTLSVQFDDLLDASTITSETLRVMMGVPSTIPFEVRIFADPNFGDLADPDGDGSAAMYSTRVLLDFAVNEIESFSSDPPIAINGVGLPPSVLVGQTNMLLRLPSQEAGLVGQNTILRNLAGSSLNASINGQADFSSPTQDVIRAMRSGGSDTGDQFNGFMRDSTPPVVVGASPARIPIGFSPQPLLGGTELEFTVPRLVFDSGTCSQTPRPGDVLVQGTVYAEVTSFAAPVDPATGVAENFTVRLLLYPNAWDAPGGAGASTWISTAIGPVSYRAAFDPQSDAAKAPCFLQIFPQPAGFPAFPADGIYTDSTASLRFSEPMDPASMTAFDSLTMTRDPAPGFLDPPLPSSSYVVGSVSQSLDQRAFTFRPDLSLAHTLGQQESYYLTIVSGNDGPTDLAGNPLEEGLPSIEMKVGSTNPTVANGGRVSRFVNPDEEPPTEASNENDYPGPKHEYSGQHLFDIQGQAIRPRPVVRFRAMADQSQPLPGAMTTFGPGVQTPLSRFGSRMQTVYRYVDFGFGLTDRTNHNLDVEGIYWSPAGGQVQSDHYDEFELVLAHSKFAPDEFIDPGSLFPQFQNSGLRNIFSNNYLSELDDPPKVVHPRGLGYTVAPGALLVASNGTKIMPYPLNRDLPVTDHVYWTWRDSSVLNRGGTASAGVDPRQFYDVLNLPPPNQPYYATQHVATIGLPMLFEVRCFPDDGASGANPFDILLAANSSSRPYFRAFATGGTNNQGNNVTVNPDTALTSTGGFNPGINGAPTYGRDNSFYVGAVDFIVRVSRTVSLWFPATDPQHPEPGGNNPDNVDPGDGSWSFSDPVYSEPIMEPAPEDQPSGTSIELDYRGALAVMGATQFDFPANCDGTPPAITPVFHPALVNALNLDIYGDFYWDEPAVFCANVDPNHRSNLANSGITFTADSSWSSDISALNGSKYYQLRITFINNPVSGLGAGLSALALSWQE